MMKNRRLEELKDKYFDGKSSSEEERELKKSDELFFQLLDQEKDVKMDWSFEDFENQVKADKKNHQMARQYLDKICCCGNSPGGYGINFLSESRASYTAVGTC